MRVQINKWDLIPSDLGETAAKGDAKNATANAIALFIYARVESQEREDVVVAGQSLEKTKMAKTNILFSVLWALLLLFIVWPVSWFCAWVSLEECFGRVSRLYSWDEADRLSYNRLRCASRCLGSFLCNYSQFSSELAACFGEARLSVGVRASIDRLLLGGFAFRQESPSLADRLVLFLSSGGAS